MIPRNECDLTTEAMIAKSSRPNLRPVVTLEATLAPTRQNATARKMMEIITRLVPRPWKPTSLASRTAIVSQGQVGYDAKGMNDL